jgi:hypothetical protein
MRKDILMEALNYLYDDRVYKVYKKTILTYSRATIEESQTMLNELEKAGYLEIIKPLAECEDLEKCIRLIKRIERDQ